AQSASVDKAAQRIWANCSAMMMRRQLFLDIGGFDETFFYGYEDSDLGWKINLVGNDVMVLPTLYTYHNVLAQPGLADGRIVFHYCKNRLRSLIKNASRWSLPVRLIGYLGYSAVDLVVRSQRQAKFSALMWNIKNVRETLELRHQIQRQRVRTDTDVFGIGSGSVFPSVPLGQHRRRPVAGAPPNEATHQSTVDDRV
ncbi:MAG: glycosyltransferase family 2 protein, partial [Pseudomonadota bacterium]